MSGSTGDLLSTGLQVGGSIGSALIGKQTAEDAARTQAQALQQGQQVSQEAIKQGRRDILAAGQPGLEDLISGFQGAIGVLEQPFATGEEFTATPGQEFLRGEQEQALMRNAAAMGGLGGGRVRSALQEQAFGRASTAQDAERAMQQQRQANIANILSGGGAQVAQYRGGLGSNLANMALGGAAQQIPLITGTGAAQASGQFLGGQALQQGLSGLGKTLGSFS